MLGTEKKSVFLDFPTAAEEAGMSIRHFRRSVEDDKIPVVQIGRKFFLLRAEFEKWQKAANTKAEGL